MQGKIFGIPLTVIVLIIAIVSPVIAGQVLLSKQIREVRQIVRVSQEETRAVLFPVVTVTEMATPSATPTEKKVRVWTPTVVPTNIP